MASKKPVREKCNHCGRPSRELGEDGEGGLICVACYEQRTVDFEKVLSKSIAVMREVK